MNRTEYSLLKPGDKVTPIFGYDRSKICEVVDVGQGNGWITVKLLDLDDMFEGSLYENPSSTYRAFRVLNGQDLTSRYPKRDARLTAKFCKDAKDILPIKEFNSNAEISILQHNLRFIRLYLGWSSLFMADYLGMSRAGYQSVENGQNKMKRAMYLAIIYIFTREHASGNVSDTQFNLIKKMLNSKIKKFNYGEEVIFET